MSEWIESFKKWFESLPGYPHHEWLVEFYYTATYFEFMAFVFAFLFAVWFVGFLVEVCIRTIRLPDIVWVLIMGALSVATAGLVVVRIMQIADSEQTLRDSSLLDVVGPLAQVAMGIWGCVMLWLFAYYGWDDIREKFKQRKNNKGHEKVVKVRLAEADYSLREADDASDEYDDTLKRNEAAEHRELLEDAISNTEAEHTIKRGKSRSIKRLFSIFAITIVGVAGYFYFDDAKAYVRDYFSEKARAKEELIEEYRNRAQSAATPKDALKIYAEAILAKLGKEATAKFYSNLGLQFHFNSMSHRAFEYYEKALTFQPNNCFIVEEARDMAEKLIYERYRYELPAFKDKSFISPEAILGAGEDVWSQLMESYYINDRGRQQYGFKYQDLKGKLDLLKERGKCQ
jgi:tetratricopeptide (TPR) repeat protein